MKRVMCLWFPNWPIQRRHAAGPSDNSRPLIVHSPLDRGKTRVVACCRFARQRGARPGMLLAEAQSLWPASGAAVRFEQDDPAADRLALRELALWCCQFSPTVAIDDAEMPDCLLLDATGCGYWFGGEEGFAGKASAALRRHGYWAAAVIADTVGAAWAMAHGRLSRSLRAGGGAEAKVLVVPPGQHAEFLRPLPVESLRLPANAVQILHELNVFRIDQLLALPRAGLPSRFGPELPRRIDQSLGTMPEMLAPERPADPLEACWEFEPPITDGRGLVTVIDRLLARLLGLMSGSRIPDSEWETPAANEAAKPEAEPRHLGIQRLLCSLKLASRDVMRLSIELLRPSASPRRIMELVRLQVERLRIPEEVTSVTVQAALTAPLDFEQDELFGGSEELNGRKEVDELIERLSNRLGEQAVLRPRLWPDAQPEYACRYGPWLSDTHAADASAPPSAMRPIFLKRRPSAIAVISIVPGSSPKQFRWNERQYIVERAWGPERIETGWWREADVRRDYYLVQTHSGERFWLFRNLADESWHLHGVFG